MKEIMQFKTLRAPSLMAEDVNHKGYISLFWWELKFLIGISCVAALAAWSLTQFNFYEWPPYRNLDLSASLYFPGISSFSRTSAVPPAWRFYLYLMSIAVALGCLRAVVACRSLSGSPVNFNQTRHVFIVFLAMVVLWGNTWLVLFNTKTAAISVTSRGFGLLFLFQTSYFGMALSGWIFFFFIMICATAIAKILFNIGSKNE